MKRMDVINNKCQCPGPFLLGPEANRKAKLLAKGRLLLELLEETAAKEVIPTILPSSSASSHPPFPAFLAVDRRALHSAFPNSAVTTSTIRPSTSHRVFIDIVVVGFFFISIMDLYLRIQLVGFSLSSKQTGDPSYRYIYTHTKIWLIRTVNDLEWGLFRNILTRPFLPITRSGFTLKLLWRWNLTLYILKYKFDNMCIYFHST